MDDALSAWRQLHALSFISLLDVLKLWRGPRSLERYRAGPDSMPAMTSGRSVWKMKGIAHVDLEFPSRGCLNP